jgi:hypothetical protein
MGLSWHPVDYNVCSLLQYQKEESRAESEPGLLDLIHPLITISLRQCGDQGKGLSFADLERVLG